MVYDFLPAVSGLFALAPPRAIPEDRCHRSLVHDLNALTIAVSAGGPTRAEDRNEDKLS
jgi:hypothetical protein